MGDKKVADLTVEEFKALITQIVDERLILWLQPPRPKDSRSVKEILDSIASHRWTPPPGSPSVVEMIREDRDR